MKRKNVTSLLALSWAVACGVILVACSGNDRGEDIPGPSDLYSPYVTKVLDFCPAPGQFTNTMPTWQEGDTQETINKKVLDIIGNNKGGMVSLGSFGGYIVVGFDHTIENVSGQRDFRLLGNAFYSNQNPNPNPSREGGNCEPGIVMVAYDKNKNGKPDDDEWYELAGSEYSNETTLKNYEITYFRPDENKTPPEVEEGALVIDPEYIHWVDNRGNDGYIVKNMYHKDNSYFPQWIEGEELTLKGNLLPPNGVDEGTAFGKGSYWVLYAYDWGYADNHLNAEEGSTFDIDWAVDKNGDPVTLPGVDFIKVYTGVLQTCGAVGDTSTEVCGVEDLHLLKK
ncbi:PKD domain-containing protein [Bacteroides sp.]|uniref:PKD domain-containing protein n=1 Tax=Bacteroides sp. TaxID=29523 RepID=UPI0026294C77|nr:PKD domain-containing protein [Bacteroides sp.]MDD3038659.1 PKD domain-containing protein [Bacteroides sp.]